MKYVIGTAIVLVAIVIAIFVGYTIDREKELDKTRKEIATLRMNGIQSPKSSPISPPIIINIVSSPESWDDVVDGWSEAIDSLKVCKEKLLEISKVDTSEKMMTILDQNNELLENSEKMLAVVIEMKKMNTEPTRKDLEFVKVLKESTENLKKEVDMLYRLHEMKKND